MTERVVLFAILVTVHGAGALLACWIGATFGQCWDLALMGYLIGTTVLLAWDKADNEAGQ